MINTNNMLHDTVINQYKTADSLRCGDKIRLDNNEQVTVKDSRRGLFLGDWAIDYRIGKTCGSIRVEQTKLFRI